jgi:glycolate oxidase iron-sulfur subunit
MTATAAVLDCVHCGLCLQACPTYDVLGLETDSPRGRIHLVRAWSEQRIDDIDAIRPHLDRCLGCRACETACPSGVRYGEILELARSEMEGRKPAAGMAARWQRFLLAGVLAHPRRLRFAFRAMRLAELLGLRRLAEWLRLAPSLTRDLVPRIPPAREREPLLGTFEPDSKPRGTVVLFTGCVMPELFGNINRKTLRLLLANGFRVEVPSAQVCCGALHVHNGQPETARRLAQQNVTAFRNADGRSLAARSKDVLEFLAEEGLTATPARQRSRVAYDDPCHLCHGQGVRVAPRELLAQVQDLTLVPHEDPETCCGSAGIYNLTQQRMAAEIGARKVRKLLAASPDLVATGNPGCMMQIRAHLRRAGSTIPVLHPVELLLPGSS